MIKRNSNYEFIVLDEHRKPNVYAISSLCEDGSHIIIWDFDIKKEPKNLCKIENSLKSVQRTFLLSKIYIFESRFGYNAICLDKLQKNEVANIKNMTSFDDKKHLEQGILYNWKLRIGPDKKYVSYVDVERFKKHTMSNSHRIALKILFGLQVDNDAYFDQNLKLCLYSYWDWKIADKSGQLNVTEKNDEQIENGNMEYTIGDR
jgi:hypothetical protein